MARLIFITLLFSTLTLQAQPTGNMGKYMEDFDYFVENLIATHPDPFTAFGNEIGFYNAKQKTREEVLKVSSDIEFIALLNRFISQLEDGHTYINKSPQTVGAKTKYLPLRFKASSDRLFIQNTAEEYKMLIGKPVIAINDIPIDSLLNRVTACFPSENISGRYFGLMYLLWNNINAREFFGNRSDTLKLTLNGSDRNISLDIPYTVKVSWLDRKSSVSLPNRNSWINWSMIGEDGKIGYFQWNSILSRELLEEVYRDNPQTIERSLRWVYGNSSKEKRTGDIQKDIMQVPALYEQFFNLLQEMQSRGSKYLIIDLRNNSGGMTPLIRPLLYILYGDRYLNFDFDATYTVKISPLLLRKYGVTIDQYNKRNQTDYVMGDYHSTNFGNVPGESLRDKVELVENGYMGLGSEYVRRSRNLNVKPHIVVLTSIHTFSAAYHFTYFLKKLGNATIVGVAPRQAGNAFMENTPIELPNTKITGSISNAAQILFKRDSPKAKLLYPDFEMDWKEFNQYHFDNEAELLKALELIDRNQINMR